MPEETDSTIKLPFANNKLVSRTNTGVPTAGGVTVDTVTVLDPADIAIAVTLDKIVCPSNAHGLLLTRARFSHFVVC